MPRTTLTKKDKEEIVRLRKLFPTGIHVLVSRSVDGGFVACIADFQCITEANTFSELIEMVNDALYTFFEIPKKYLSFMPSFVPPLKVAQRFSVFPVRRVSEVLKFSTTLPASSLL